MKKLFSLMTFCTVLLIVNIMISNIEANAFADTGKTLKIDMDEIKGKLDPWLFDKIQNLTPTGSTNEITLVVVLKAIDRKVTEIDETIYADLFSEKYKAEILYVADKLGIVIIKTSVENALDIATRDYVLKLGDGEQKLETNLNVSAQAIRARPDVWNLGHKGSGIKIAIIDTGIDATHPDLDDIDDDPNTYDPKVILEHDFTWEGITYDMSPDGHGTHVAGIAAGTGKWSRENLADNSWFIGVAPEAFLFNYRVFNSSGVGLVAWAIQAINWAVSNGSDIINLSFGVSANGDGTHPLSIAADNAVDNGVVVVAAANDHPVDGDYPIGIPADAFNVITVGSINDMETVNINDDNRSSFSGHGPTLDGRVKPDVMAPGEDIWSTGQWQLGIIYRPLWGTSMAAPHVSGVAALMLQAHPEWKGKPLFVKSVIKRTARLNNNLAQLTENYRGEGIVDALLAVHNSMEIPITPADSSYTSGWGEYHYAEANTADASYRLKVGTTLMNGEDSYAIATLKKNFTPNQTITNPTFYFAFHDKGYMDAHKAPYAYTNLNAFLRLWHNGIELSQYNPVIHYVSNSYYAPNCFHETSWTYYGEMLEGNTYTIEYGFTLYEHEAWADFRTADRKISADWLLLADNYKLTVKTRVIGGSEISGVNVWVDGSPVSPSPVTVIVSAGDHIVQVKSYFLRGSFEYTFSHWEDSSTNNPRTVPVSSNKTITAYYDKEYIGTCPTLFVWNGTDYAYETLLDIRGDSDVTLQHRIEQPLVKDGIFYKLSLRELDEFTSHIDQVKLYAVDANGMMHTCFLTSATHSQLGRVTAFLWLDDEIRVDLHPTETINLKFTLPCFHSNIAYFTFEINGHNRKIE